MSLKAYEDACLRAELFGQPVPDKDDYLAKHKHLDVVEFEEVDIRTAAENTAMLDENLREATGGLHELNTILSSTQTKINKLKGVCGSLTNFFRVKISSKDGLSYSSDPSYIGQPNYDAGTTDVGSINEGLGPNDREMMPSAGSTKQNGGGINSAIDDLKTMKKNEKTAVVNKASALDIKSQVTSQISKLDHMIGQADKAEAALQSQNKDMRKFLR